MDPEYQTPFDKKDPNYETIIKRSADRIVYDVLIQALNDLLESIARVSTDKAVYEYIGDLDEFKELAKDRIRYTIFTKHVKGSSNPAGQIPIFAQIWIRASSLDESGNVIVFAHMIGQDLAIIKESINDLRKKGSLFAEKYLPEGKWGQWAYAADPEMP